MAQDPVLVGTQDNDGTGDSLRAGGQKLNADIAELFTLFATSQPLDASLTAYAALVTAADRGLYFTGADVPALFTLTAAGRALLDDADATAMRVTLGLVIGTNVQGWDADLDAIAALGSTGIAVRTAANTWAQRTLQPPAAGLTITNPAGVAGDPTLVLAHDLAAVEALSGTGIARRTGSDAWSVGATVTVAEGGSGAVTLTGLLQGNGTGAFTGIANSSTVGQVLRVTGASTYAWGALDLGDADAVTGILPAANLPDASATAEGIVELATDAETVTGTDTARATTPANIAAKMAAPGAIGATTPAAGSFTNLNITGDLATAPSFDVSSRTYTIGAGVSQTVVSNASGVLFLTDHTFSGSTAIYLVGGTAVLEIGESQPGTWIASASPSSIQFGVHFDTPNYKVKNGSASNATFSAFFFKLRSSF